MFSRYRFLNVMDLINRLFDFSPGAIFSSSNDLHRVSMD